MDENAKIYCSLYPYRSLTPQSILSAVRCEALAPIFNISRIMDFLERNSTEPKLPPQMVLISEELSQAGKHLHNILTSYTETETVATQETINTFREEFIPQIEMLRRVIKQFQSVEAEMEEFFPWISDWVNRTEEGISHIHVVADVLTNPEFEIPNHLEAWLSIRDEVVKKATKGDAEVLPIILQVLDNPEPAIRKEATRLLRHLKSPELVDPLVMLLNDPSEDVRKEAVELLGVLGDHKAIEPLAELLTQIGITVPLALINLGDPRGKEHLINLLKGEDHTYKNQALSILISLEKQKLENMNVSKQDIESESTDGLAFDLKLHSTTINALETYIQYYGTFSREAHNELRHLYGAISENKSMKHANIILANVIMDHYILHTLSDWHLDLESRNTPFNPEMGVKLLLKKVEDYPDLVYLRAACLVKAADVCQSINQLNLTRRFYQQVLELRDSGSIQTLDAYHNIAWRNLISL
ncbi:MAG: HEAT repeat domain-containing protein [Chloroflexi bacterium]|nr:HEAT repeat domain-containing protein [Chloroflexota bacterium]